MGAATETHAQKPLTDTYNSTASRQKTSSRDWLRAKSGERQSGLRDIEKLKASVDFAALVGETHEVRGKKVVCPSPDHDDHNPSCRIYDNGFKCYACGASGDAITWLEYVQGLSTGEAIRALEGRSGSTFIVETTTPKIRGTAKSPSEAAPYKAVDPGIVAIHYRCADKLRRGPAALAGRGFTLRDLRRLGIAADGDDAVLPITGPDGAVLALKKRYANPRGKMRYVYEPSGHGTPAWCSPGFLEAAYILVIEGELNGMVAWCARPDLGVMGVAGTSGHIYPEPLKGRTVYVYGDGDAVGRVARDRWAGDAVKAGAARVYVLEPWEMDACDIAGQLGRVELAGRLS